MFMQVQQRGRIQTASHLVPLVGTVCTNNLNLYTYLTQNVSDDLALRVSDDLALRVLRVHGLRG